MKKLLFIALTIFILASQSGYSQDIPEEAIMIDENTIIKDESGNKVEMFELMELMESGEWTMDPIKDKEGDLLYMQLRKTTDEEKQMMSSIPMSGSNSEKIGEKAPDFEMKDIDGNLISLETTKGKVVVLNFWFTACKPCISEIPELNEVYEKYINDTNIVFASITFDKEEQVVAFLKKHPIKYPVVSNAKKVCDIFNVSSYPTNIVIDKDGNYYDCISGGFPHIGNQISNSIQNALDGKDPILSSSQPEGIMIDPNSTFILENGKVIKFEKAIELIDSDKYEILPKKTKSGKEYFLLKEK